MGRILPVKPQSSNSDSFWVRRSALLADKIVAMPPITLPNAAAMQVRAINRPQDGPPSYASPLSVPSSKTADTKKTKQKNHIAKAVLNRDRVSHGRLVFIRLR